MKPGVKPDLKRLLMHIRRGMFLLPVLCLLLALAPAHADSNANAAADPAARALANALADVLADTYPTVAALDSTAIPVSDPVDLARRLRGVTDIPAPPITAPDFAIGDQQRFFALNTFERRQFTVEATLRAAGQHILLWVENGVDIDNGELSAITDAFDTRVYPGTRMLWGSEATPGVDGDPRIYGLLAHHLGSTTAAYFISANTYPVAVNPTSNAHEMFMFNLDFFPRPFSLAGIEPVIAHEFQHMIRQNLHSNQDTWLNEGLSQFTEFFLYGRVDSSVLSFLQAPRTQLTDWSADPGGRAANYGGSLLFLIYLYERFGLDAVQALAADQSPRAWEGVDRIVRQYSAESADEFFADWVMINLLQAQGVTDPRFDYASLPPLISPPAIADVRLYPYDHDGALTPYSTDYIVFQGLEGMPRMHIALDAAPEIALFPSPSFSGHAMYSNRADLSDTRLTRVFDLTGVSAATLSYRVWYDLENQWDYGYVMVSRDGQIWTPLAAAHTSTNDPNDRSYGAGYTGSSQGWLDDSVSLDTYAGAPVFIRFETITDDAVNRPGMVIDDVRIDAIGYRTDFESDDGGWLAEGWLRTDNRLPAAFTVQAAVLTDSGGVQVTRWNTQGDGAWTLPLPPDAHRLWLAVSPTAPVTTALLAYHLSAAPEQPG